MKSAFYFILFSLVIIFAAFWVSNKDSTFDGVANFDQCARLGYPVMESYPRQCTTPEGETFVEGAVTEICRYQQDCGDGYYCRFGVCTEFVPETACQTDDDCQLIKIDYGFGCCWIGACNPIDYSEEQWTAVNTHWFAQGHEEACPTEEECGPAPLCPVELINEDYEARCVQLDEFGSKPQCAKMSRS